MFAYVIFNESNNLGLNVQSHLQSFNSVYRHIILYIQFC